MITRQYAQFSVYAVEPAIPRYQRAWVWGVAALVILLCGVAAGGLFSGMISQPWDGIRPRDERPSQDHAASLAQREAVNEQLRERVAQLERELNGNVCGPVAPDAPRRDIRHP